MSIRSAFSKITPLLDRVLVRRVVAPTKSSGGLLLPESAQHRLNQGIVVSVGPGRTNKDGERYEMSVKVGDNVLLPEYGGNSIKIDEDELMLYRDEDILGILEK